MLNFHGGHPNNVDLLVNAAAAAAGAGAEAAGAVGAAETATAGAALGKMDLTPAKTTSKKKVHHPEVGASACLDVSRSVAALPFKAHAAHAADVENESPSTPLSLGAAPAGPAAAPRPWTAAYGTLNPHQKEAEWRKTGVDLKLAFHDAMRKGLLEEEEEGKEEARSERRDEAEEDAALWDKSRSV